MAQKELKGQTVKIHGGPGIGDLCLTSLIMRRPIFFESEPVALSEGPDGALVTKFHAVIVGVRKSVRTYRSYRIGLKSPDTLDEYWLIEGVVVDPCDLLTPTGFEFEARYHTVQREGEMTISRSRD
jgi:hypothetical protein